MLQSAGLGPKGRRKGIGGCLLDRIRKAASLQDSALLGVEHPSLGLSNDVLKMCSTENNY